MRPDSRHLSMWLSLRYLPEPETLFANVGTLPAAHWMIVTRKGDKMLEKYWDPTSPTLKKESFLEHRQQDPLDTLDSLTRSSIELAMLADTLLSYYLSAGVDSSLLAYYLKDLGATPTTISIAFGSTSDENE